MSLVDQNFEIYAGNNANLIITVYKCDTTTVKDLSAATITWVLYDDNTDVTLVTKTTLSGIIIKNPPTAGIFTVSLLPADTVGLSETNTYRHEAIVVDNMGDETTVIVGYVIVKRSLL